MKWVLTSFCFDEQTLSGRDIASMIEAGIGFAADRITTDDFLTRGGTFKVDSHLKKIQASTRVRAVRLETRADKAGEGPYLDVTGIARFHMQVAYWKVADTEAPSLGVLNELTSMRGFNAGYSASAEDVFWQSTEMLNTYEVFRKPHDRLPKVPDETFGGLKVDISRNPGRQELFPGMWLQASWRMWFGIGAFQYMPKDRLLAFPNAHRVEELPSGAVFIELYDDPFACELAENRARQQSFREWVDMDGLARRAGDIMSERADPSFEIDEEGCTHGGVRRLTQWLDADGKPARKSRAAKRIVVELDANGDQIWRDES